MQYYGVRQASNMTAGDEAKSCGKIVLDICFVRHFLYKQWTTHSNCRLKLNTRMEMCQNKLSEAVLLNLWNQCTKMGAQSGTRYFLQPEKVVVKVVRF